MQGTFAKNSNKLWCNYRKTFAPNLEHEKNTLSSRFYRCVFFDCSLMRQKRENDSEFMAFVHNQRGSHRPQLDSLLLKPVGILFFVLTTYWYVDQQVYCAEGKAVVYVGRRSVV